MICYEIRFLPPGGDEHVLAARLRSDMYRTLLGEAEGTVLRAPSGKPYYADSPVQFSLSHSGRIVLCAMSIPGVSDSASYRVLDRSGKALPVGCDIERVRDAAEAPRLRRIAARFFSPTVRDALSSLPDGHYPYAFCRAWTRYESAVKQSGKGFGSGFAACSLSGIRFISEDIRTGDARYCLTVAVPIL